jgi:hypothetical protein
MSAKVKSVAAAMAVGLAVSIASAVPAWSQSLIGDGLPAEAYSNYYQGYGPNEWSPAPYAYGAPYAYAPRVHKHRH